MAVPDQSFFCIQPADRRWVTGLFTGTRRGLIADEQTPTLGLVTGVVELLDPGRKIDLHHHEVEEFQYIVSGTGLARDAHGTKYPVAPGTCVYCRPGPEGAHEFENTGQDPLVILFVFSSPGGRFPAIHVVNADAAIQEHDSRREKS